MECVRSRFHGVVELFLFFIIIILLLLFLGKKGTPWYYTINLFASETVTQWPYVHTEIIHF